MQELPQVETPMTHPLDETLESAAAQNADHALTILRTLPKPLSGLDLQAITIWARRQRAERLTLR